MQKILRKYTDNRCKDFIRNEMDSELFKTPDVLLYFLSNPNADDQR